MNEQTFELPDVGEGLVEADILTWLVQPGDTVAVNQVLVEIETAKAAVELPSPYAGVITKLHAEVGDTVAVGATIVSFGGDPTEPQPTKRQDTASEGSSAGDAAMLVGYGPRESTGRRARRASDTPVALAQPSAAGPLPADEPGVRVRAKPPVRKLAKTLGVDLSTVVPSGLDGIVSRADVERAATLQPVADPSASRTDAAGGADQRETRIPVRGVRKHTAAAMVRSAFTAPHVTEFVTVDVTATVELRDMVAARREFRDVKLTLLPFVARALLLALRRTPSANASWDEDAQEIVVKHYVNLGIAAATDRGLVVPNIKDADTLGLAELTAGISSLAQTARAGKTAPAAMTGGTVTITNIGVFGIDAGTPILNPGEAAILAVGAVRRAPWVILQDGKERIEPRWVTHLALSFDHRLVDGQQGSELLRDTAAVLQQPGLAML